MRVTTAAIVADFAGPHLMPGLGHVQDHAALVERLEGEGDIGGNLGEEAGIGILIRIDQLLVLVFIGNSKQKEVAHGNFAENTHAFLSMAMEKPVLLETILSIGGRLHDEDADGMDVIVRVFAGVGALIDPVERRAVLGSVERIEPLVAVGFLANITRRDAAYRNRALRIAFALVETGRSDQAIRRSDWQLLFVHTVDTSRQFLRLVDAINALVRNDGARPLLVVI